MATGFVLNIPNEMLRRLDEADRKIEQLETTAGKTADSVVQSFLHIKNAGVDALISSLNSANQALAQLGNVKFQGSGLQGVAVQATNSADEVHLLIQSIYELLDVVGKGGGRSNKTKLIDTDDDFERIADLTKQFNELKEIRERGGSEEEGALNKERERAIVNAMAALREELKFRKMSDAEQEEFLQKQIQRAKRKADAEIREAKRAFDQQEKMYKAETDRINKTYTGALAFSKTANTEHLHAQAIDYLTEARRRLTTADADYATKLNTLNVAIQEHQKFLKDATLTDQQRADAAAAAAEKVVQAVARERAAYEARKKAVLDQWYSSSDTRALSFNANAKSLDELTQSIKYMEAARNKLKITDDNYETRLRSLNEAIRLSQKVLKDATLTEEERAAAARKTEEALRKRQAAEQFADASSGPKKALAFSQNAQNINQQLEAIKALKIARDNLTNTDAQYENRVAALNAEIRRQQTEVDRLRGKSEELHKSHRNLMDISGQLARKLALVFSVSQMIGYFNKLVQVRGELEMQQRALGAILKSKKETDELWNKTVQLAVRSPYQIKELVTYTKQLAAYRVETEKLHDTTKMLADVSSGLGVDMQRLILAYGQVKAANYLRGTELRQFSEAGINILGELATYFSEIEGKGVSVAEVFDRVSKRMVTFADVEEIFKRITSAGGAFYQMQEIQADTLKGQISNLKDAITVMLNEIGEANDDLLKGGVGALRVLIEHWQIFPPLIATVISSLSIAKIAALTTNAEIQDMAKAMGVLTESAQGQLSIWQLIQVGFNKIRSSASNLGASLASFIALNGPLLAIVAALSAAAMALFDFIKYNRELKAIAKEFEQMRKPIQDIGIAFTKAEWKGELQSMKSELNKLIALAEREYELHFDLSIEDVEKMNLSQVEAAFEQVRERVLNANRLAEDFAAAMTKAQQKQQWFFGDAKAIGDMSFGEGLWMSTFGGVFSGNFQSMSKDIGQFGKTAKQTFDLIRQDANNATNAIMSFNAELTDEQRLLIDNLTRTQERGETEAAYFKRIREAYEALMPILEAVGYQNDKIDRKLRRLAKREGEVRREFEKFSFDVNELWSEEERTAALQVAIDKFAWDQNYNDFQKDLLYRLARDKYNVQIGITTKDDANKALSPQWIQNVTDKLKEVNQKIAQAAKKQGVPETQLLSFPLPAEGDTQEDFLTRFKEVQTLAKQSYTETQQMYNKATVTMASILKEHLPVAEGIVNISSQENATSEKTNDIWQERATLMRKVADEAASLNEYLTDTEVAQRLPQLFGEEWKKTFSKLGIELSQFNWVDEKQVRSAFEQLIAATTDAVEKAKLQLAYAEWQVNVDVDIRKGTLDELKSEIDAAFEKYDLWLDLKKLGFSPDMARRLFGLDTLSLGQLRAEIEDSKGQFDVLSDAGKQAYAEYLKKVEEMERKAQYDRLKEYLEYSRKSIGERAKIKLEELQHLQTIEQQFVAKEGASGAEIRLVEEQKAKAREDVRAKALSKMQAFDWKEFQQTETFIHLMGDLEHASNEALTSMIDQLEGFRKQWTNMPLDEMKQIVKLINKLEEARLENVNPFSEAKLVKAKIEEDGRSKAEAEVDLIQGEQQLKIINETLAVYEAINARRAEGATNEQLITEFGQQYVDVIEGGSGAMTLMTGSMQRQKKTAQQLVDTSKDQLQNYGNLAKLYKLQEERYKTALELAHDLYNAFESIYDAVGGDNDSIVKTFADMGMTMLDAVMNTIMLRLQLKAAEAAGVEMGAAMNAAMGPIGWIVMAVEILAAGLSAAFKAHDQGLENQIERLTDYVENLQKQYERLEQAIDDAFNTSQMRSYTEQLKSTANAQISYLRAMIALEEDKKSTDEDRIKEWEDEIESLGDSLAEALQNAVSKATAGILDDTFSVARDFVDAWYDSFQEVGDGISGLEDNFQEMFLNLIKQQAALQIAGDFIDRWKKYLEAYVDKEDLILTTEEAKKWAAQVKEEIPDLSLMLENLFGVFGEGVTDLTEKSSLSGLQKGISSITEETAQILEAYLNSVRFYVADSNSKLAQLVATWANPEIENPMLTNLKIIAKQTTDIHTLLESLTAPHPTESGRGLKVII